MTGHLSAKADAATILELTAADIERHASWDSPLDALLFALMPADVLVAAIARYELAWVAGLVSRPDALPPFEHIDAWGAGIGHTGGIAALRLAAHNLRHGVEAKPLVSGRLAPDGGGWCYYCGMHHAKATTKRTPCCGDCWYPEAPERCGGRDPAFAGECPLPRGHAGGCWGEDAYG